MDVIGDMKKLANSRGWSNLGRVVLFESTINGYHSFKKRPHVGIEFVMSCKREPQNPYDSKAVLVVAPNLQDVPAHLHPVVTREKEQQTVADVCGKDIGRVPRGLSKIFSDGLRDGAIVEAVAVHIGGFEHGGPVRGGGPQLKCAYMVVLKGSSAGKVTKAITSVVGKRCCVL